MVTDGATAFPQFNPRVLQGKTRLRIRIAAHIRHGLRMTASPNLNQREFFYSA